MNLNELIPQDIGKERLNRTLAFVLDMTQLIACLSTGKGTWAQVSKLINAEGWDEVILITNDFGKEKFTPNEKTKIVALNLDKDVMSLHEEIFTILKENVKGIEVALNICSGTGKEHSALITAVQKTGVGIRFVELVNDKCVNL